MRWKRSVTLLLDENAAALHWCELCTNYKNTSYLFTVHYLIMMQEIKTNMNYSLSGAVPWGGARGAKKTLKISKKGKMKKYDVFSGNKVIKIAFLSSVTRKYMLWKGFYRDFITKKASASRGSAPWTPEVPSPSQRFTLAPPCSLSLVWNESIAGSQHDLGQFRRVTVHSHGGQWRGLGLGSRVMLSWMILPHLLTC